MPPSKPGWPWPPPLHFFLRRREKEKKTSREWSLFNAVSSRAPLDAVQLLLKDGADVNAEDNGGHTALHIAAKLGYSAAVALRLPQRAATRGLRVSSKPAQLAFPEDERVKVNVEDNCGWTPLHWGAARGRSVHRSPYLPQDRAQGEWERRTLECRAVVELPATHGAGVTAEDDERWTPIHRAARRVGGGEGRAGRRHFRLPAPRDGRDRALGQERGEGALQAAGGRAAARPPKCRRVGAA